MTTSNKRTSANDKAKNKIREEKSDMIGDNEHVFHSFSMRTSKYSNRIVLSELSFTGMLLSFYFIDCLRVLREIKLTYFFFSSFI